MAGVGMHFGILAADVDWPELLGLLREQALGLVERGALASEEEVEAWFAGQAWDEGYRLMGGAQEGKAYLLDTSHLLSGIEPDLIASLAAASGRLVVGCGAETASETYYLVAARGGEVLRHHYHCCYSAIAVPYDSGAPLPTEEEDPLDGRMGEGMLAALRYFGFNYDAWSDAGTHHAILWTDEHPPAAEDTTRPTPLGAAVARHMANHELESSTHGPRGHYPPDPPTGARWLRRLARLIGL
jgi:hypothetical protein